MGENQAIRSSPPSALSNHKNDGKEDVGTTTTTPARRAVFFTVIAAFCWAAISFSPAPARATGGGVDVALNLAELLRAARSVIAANQTLINDADRGDKGLTADVVLRETLTIYQDKTGFRPNSFPKRSLMGRLMRAQIAAIREVMNDNQATINAQGVGFKGFVPAVFARLVNERFKAKVGHEAEIKVTAPSHLVRNRKARPDSWESSVIDTKLQSPDWPRGKIFAKHTEKNGRPALRVLVPEYYGKGCLSCHGGPTSEVDITGYRKEGGKLGDLGGAISITLFDGR